MSWDDQTIPDVGSAPEPQRGTAQLLSIAGGVPTVNLGDGRTSFGRLADNHVQLPSDRVSRRHAEVFREGAQWFVVDLDSSNGTLLNRRRLAPSRREPLQNQDLLQIADFRFLFVDWRRQLPDQPLEDFELDCDAVRAEVDKLLEQFRLDPGSRAGG